MCHEGPPQHACHMTAVQFVASDNFIINWHRLCTVSSGRSSAARQDEREGSLIMANKGDERFIVRETLYNGTEKPVRSRRQFSSRMAAEGHKRALLARREPTRVTIIREIIEQDDMNFRW